MTWGRGAERHPVKTGEALGQNTFGQIYWHGLGPCADPQAVREIHTAEMRGEQPRRIYQPPDSPQYVYASPSKEVAIAFSTLAGGRSICRIDPGPLPAEPDTDFPTLGVRFRGPVKVIATQVLQPETLPTARQIAETLAPDSRWPNGTNWYTPDGYLRTPPALHLMGYSDEDFTWLGPWFPLFFLAVERNGRAAALTDDGHAHIMFPPDHPDTVGLRRVPTRSIAHTWRDPGYFPTQEELLMALEVHAKWQPAVFDQLNHMPWD